MGHRYIIAIQGVVHPLPRIGREEFHAVVESVAERRRAGERTRDYSLLVENADMMVGSYGGIISLSEQMMAGVVPRFSIVPNIEFDEYLHVDEVKASLGEVVADFAVAPDGTQRLFEGYFQFEERYKNMLEDVSRLYVVDGEVVEAAPEIIWHNPMKVTRIQDEQRMEQDHGQS